LEAIIHPSFHIYSKSWKVQWYIIQQNRSNRYHCSGYWELFTT
jgi:hypothetical protein